MAEGDWYWRELEGRWRVFPETEGSTWNDRFPPTDHALLREVRDELDAHGVPNGVALVDLEVVARCDDCHDVLTRSGDLYWHGRRNGSVWNWSTPASSLAEIEGLGDHRHDDPSGDGVRFYALHAVGPWKTECHGTWADVVRLHHFLVQRRFPMPPRSAVNEALREGRYEAGMSGGVEAPPHELTAAEYVDVCESLRTEFAVPDVEAPDGLSRSEYEAWVSAHPDRESWERAVREDIRRLSDGGSR